VTVAADRSELLNEQRQRIARDAARPRPLTDAVRERLARDRAALGLDAAPAPPAHVEVRVDHTWATSAPARPLTPRERQDAADRAPITWLRKPVWIGPRRRTRVLGFATPPGPPEWLAEILAAER
jgi:hypothetical protein